MGHPEIYSHEYYRRIADLEDTHWWHVGMREIAGRLIKSLDGEGNGMRVLDAGCGTGGAMAWVREVLGASPVIGVDISRHALEFCRGRQVGPQLLQASVLQLPFRDASFDLLLCHDVLQHLPTDGLDGHALGEMHRVLRPGGLLLLGTNSRLGMWQADGARDEDFQRYTLPEVVSRLQAAGFVVKRATYANCLPALYGSLKRWLQRRQGHHQGHRLYEGLSVGGGEFRRAWLNRILIWIMKGEARYLSAPGRALAFGHSTLCVAAKPAAAR